MQIKHRIVAGICAVSLLLLCGCKQEVDEPAQQEETIPVVTEDDLMRKIPSYYEGKGEIFDLTEEEYSAESAVELVPVTLHCSDNVDRQSYSLNSSPVYLSNGSEGSDTADGVCSTSSNLTLLSQVGLLEGNSVGAVLDTLVNRQALDGSENSSLLVSNTLNLAENVYLTDVIYTEEGKCMEAFYLLQQLDAETVHLYILSRIYEEIDKTYEEINSMDTDQLLFYCLSSDENREVFCGILQSLLTAVSA